MTGWEIFAIIAAIVGLVGSIVPALPGPPISWVGLLLLFLGGSTHGDEPMSLTFLLVWLAIMIIVTVLDYLVPIWTTRWTGGHKAASWGAMIGLFAGMLIPPIGIIVGSLGGAFLGELLVTDKGLWAAFKAGFGAFLGFILGTGLKLASAGVMAYYIFAYVFF